MDRPDHNSDSPRGRNIISFTSAAKDHALTHREESFPATALRHLRASNEEILGLEDELRTMDPMWSEIRVPVTVIQGGRDKLVRPGNVEFAERVLVNSDLEIVMVEDINHFVPLSNPQLIRDAIDGHLDRVERRTTIHDTLRAVRPRERSMQ